MLEMHQDRAVAELFAADPGVLEPFAELTVQSAIAQAFIEAVDRDDVTLPRARIAAIEARAGRCQRIERAERRRATSARRA